MLRDVSNDNGVAEKALNDDAVRRSVQAIPTGDPKPTTYGSSMLPLYFVANKADEFEPWGGATKLRDGQLRAFIPSEPMFASALGIIVARNAAFSWVVEGPKAKAEQFQKILHASQFGLGWAHLISRVSIDLYTQDSGAFIEIIRDGDAPDAAVISLAHLDSARCYHTGVPEAPVIYQDDGGKYHTLKWYQVIVLSEMPSPYSNLGLQYCALTRLLRAAQILRDISIYIQEKVSGQHTRAITLLKGVTAQQVDDAVNLARLKQLSAGMQRFSMPLLVSSVDPRAEVGFETLEISALPDGFDLDLTYKHYIAQIAMAFLSDYQEFAPLPGGNLGSSSQSEILHLKTRGKGPALFQKLISTAINNLVLPDDTEFKFDEQDEAQDKAVAEVKGLRATERSTRITAGELTPHAAMQLAVDDGDLPQELMDAMLKEEEAKAAEEQKRLQQLQQPQPGTPARTPSDVTPNNAQAPEEAQLAKPTTGGQTMAENQKAKAPPAARVAVEQEVQSVIESTFSDLYERMLKRAGVDDTTDDEQGKTVEPTPPMRRVVVKHLLRDADGRVAGVREEELFEPVTEPELEYAQ